MRSAFCLVAAAALAAIAGCHSEEPAPEPRLNLTVLSTGLIAKYHITNDELMKLQYYLDGRLVIQRRLNEGERQVAHGKIVVRNGVDVNEVVVEPLTPGVAIGRERDGKGLDVGFDPTSQAAFAFGPCASGDYELGCDAKGRIPYDGLSYSRETSGNRLLVDLTAISHLETTRKTLPGRTIDDR